MNKVLALLVRALRTESRDIKSHLFRFGLAVIIVLILMTGASAIEYETAPGRLIFKSMIVANWIVVTLAAGTFFSIAISEETEQQTLGLLRMANVSPLALLLGKWLPRLLAAVVLILVQFPFTWLTVTLGGVNWQQIWASYLMLLAHLFLVGNLGLLCSVLRPNSASACGLTFLLMIIARVMPGVILGALALASSFGWIPSRTVSDFQQNVFGTLNSWSASGRLFGEILSTSFKGSPWTSQVISNLIAGSILFFLAWLVFDRVTMNHMSGATSSGGLRSLVTRWFSKSKRRSSAVWDWAIGWKDFTQTAGGQRMIIMKFALYAGLWLFVGFIASYERRSSIDDVFEMACGFVAGIILWLILPLELAFMAAKLYRPELNDHTWSTLLTLPKSLSEISYSKLGGAALGLIPSICVLSLTGLPFLGELLREISREGTILLVIGYVFTAIIAALHLITFYSVSISWAAWPIAVILGVGTVWLGNMICWFMVLMLMFAARSGGGDEVFTAFSILLAIGNILVAGVVHHAIGQKLMAKGAES